MAEMGLFHRLKLKNRFYARLGAFVRARETGLSEDDAWAHALRIHPATAEDLAYEDELRERGHDVALGFRDNPGGVMGFLKAFTTNVQRGKRLQPWVAVLGKPLLDGTPLSGLSERIAEQSVALDSLLDFCMNDEQTGPVVRAHGTTKAELQTMYGEISFCAGVWRGSNYVPAAVFGFPKPLEHFLANRKKIADVDLASQLVTMFETHTYL